MPIEKILIVDDELLIRNFLAETLRRKNMDDRQQLQMVKKLLSLLKESVFDMVITDMKMPDITGHRCVEKSQRTFAANTIVMVITAFGSIENAVEAMRLGAFHYLIKPFSPETIEAAIEKAREHVFLLEENQYLRQQVSPGGTHSQLKLSQKARP